jgi:SH3-like domain-containing protein
MISNIGEPLSGFSQMDSFYVIADWEASYENPIALAVGDEVWLSGKIDNWDGHVWAWAKDRTGREGWIPDNLAEDVGDRTYARSSFSAQELTCQSGEKLDGIDKTHGWVLCRNADGLVGWVPSRNLRQTNDR